MCEPYLFVRLSFWLRGPFTLTRRFAPPQERFTTDGELNVVESFESWILDYLKVKDKCVSLKERFFTILYRIIFYDYCEIKSPSKLSGKLRCKTKIPQNFANS